MVRFGGVYPIGIHPLAYKSFVEAFPIIVTCRLLIGTVNSHTGVGWIGGGHDVVALLHQLVVLFEMSVLLGVRPEVGPE